MHGAMPVDPAHLPKGGCCDDHPEMAFALFPPAAVTAMLVTFVDNLQGRRREGRRQAGMYFVRDTHFQRFTPSIPQQKL
jgi:hypothetical protein